MVQPTSHLDKSHNINLKQPSLMKGDGEDIKLGKKMSIEKPGHQRITYPFINNHIDLIGHLGHLIRPCLHDEPFCPRVILQIFPPPLIHCCMCPHCEAHILTKVTEIGSPLLESFVLHK